MNPYILYRNMLMSEYVFVYLQILEVKILTVYNFNDQFGGSMVTTVYT